jgi:hypothetical protein
MYRYFDSALDVGLYPRFKVLSGPNTVDKTLLFYKTGPRTYRIL